jgi:hypothetical protein
MHRLTAWLGNTFTAMARGCLVLAVVALAGSIGIFYAVTRHLPRTGDWVLITLLVVAAGLLGGVGVLAWRLSHLGHVAHAVRSVREHANVPR